MSEAGEYKKILTEFIQKQMMVLGPNIALDKARNVSGLVVDSSGAATDLRGDPALIVKDIVKEYMGLSEATTRMILTNLLEKYPAMKALKLI